MRAINLMAAAALALFVVSCARKPRLNPANETKAPPAVSGVPTTQPSIVGKWLTPTGGSIEFKANGSATMAGPAGSREVTYRLPDERTIEISRPGGTATIRWQVVSLKAQELVITDANGMEVRLRRGGLAMPITPPQS